MLSLLPLLSSLAAIASPAGAPDPILHVPTSAVASVDTGSKQDSIVLLTPAIVTPYAATEKALAAYWAAHPDQSKQALEHAHAVNITIANKNQPTNLPASVPTGGMINTTGFSVPDYPTVAQHDPVVAAIFTNAHFSPAQFEPTERAVRLAIAAVLQQQAPDSTMMGQNMAVVQAHRPELAADWSEVQSAIHIVQGFSQQLTTNLNQSLNNQQNGQGSDLEP